MSRTQSSSGSDSESIQRTTRGEQDNNSDALTARGDDGENELAQKTDVEKGLPAGSSEAEKVTDEDGEERTERDADGVAVEDGVPLVKLTGDDDPLS